MVRTTTMNVETISTRKHGFDLIALIYCQSKRQVLLQSFFEGNQSTVHFSVRYFKILWGIPTEVQGAALGRSPTLRAICFHYSLGQLRTGFGPLAQWSRLYLIEFLK